MDPTDPDRGDRDPTDEPDAGGAVQERLPLDDPVPYRLTTAGRRLVAPDDQPSLRVVGGRDRGRGPHGSPVVLESLDAADRARARAMRRGGMHTLDIAERLGADPLHVEQWVADLPVPIGARRRRLAAVPPAGRDDPRVATDAARAAVVAAWRGARDRGRDEAEQRLRASPDLRTGLGLVAGLLEPDHHALLLTGDDLDLVAAGWRWVAATFALDAGPARVLVRHDPSSAGDRVAHDVATALGVEPSAVTTTRDPARTGRAPAIRLRVADPTLAGRVAGWRRALLVDVTRTSDGADVGA